MAVDSQNAYWIDQGNGLVVKAPIGGGPVATLASGQSSPQNIGAQNGRVYWTANGNLTSVTADGTSSETIADNYSPFGVAVDSSGVFWSSIGTGNPNTGIVLTRALTGGPITVLASAQPNPTAIATNSSTVVWFNERSGEIMKVAKP
jgi:hypothetical protein